MLRKTLVALSAVAALGVSSTAMAAQGHGHSSGGGGGMAGAHVSSGGGGGGGVGMGAVRSSGPMVQGAGPVGRTVTTNRTNFSTGPNRFSPNTTFTTGSIRHHHRFHHRNAFFFGVGFAGAYGYDSCWRWVPTNWGWQRVWVCDYPYWGY